MPDNIVVKVIDLLIKGLTIVLVILVAATGIMALAKNWESQSEKVQIESVEEPSWELWDEIIVTTTNWSRPLKEPPSGKSWRYETLPGNGEVESMDKDGKIRPEGEKYDYRFDTFPFLQFRLATKDGKPVANKAYIRMDVR